MSKSLVTLGAFLGFFPLAASAHEVYVLDPVTIASEMATQSPNTFSAYFNNEGQFFFWGFIVFLTVSTVFFMSVFRTVERAALPYLRRLKRYAPLIERITVGLSLIAFAYNGALFGPELPLSGIYGNFTALAQILLFATGALILVGLFTRIAAGIVIALVLLTLPTHGWYMLMYTAYFVVSVVILIMGAGSFSLDKYFRRADNKSFIERLRKRFEPYEMLAIRIGFGLSVAIAAIYAKFLYSNLALHTIAEYNLTAYFPFEPLFIVLGALIIEVLIGAFIIFGIELRWTALFFLFWLTLSLFYFGEHVWPHLALFGLNFVIFCHGYDRYTLEGRFFKQGSREPVL